MNHIRSRNADRFPSDNPNDYVNCPRCSVRTVLRPKGVACEVCGPIEDMILASKENFDEIPAPRKAAPAPKASARIATAKG